MITEQDLQAAIAECEGQKNPTANTCMKLAAFYTIKDKMYPQGDAREEPEAVPRYSFSSARDNRTYDSDTEFMQAVKDMDTDKVWAVMDEIMSALAVYNPRLYAAAMRKLEN